MNAQAIDAVLKDATDRGLVAGVVAGVTSRDGCLYEGAFGLRGLGEPAPMTIDTVCFIASMTKAITGVACLQLVERGLLDLDAPASRYLPKLGRVEVLDGFDADGAPLLRPPKTQLSTRQLLTHTSGFVYEMWNANAKRYQETQGVPAGTSGLNRSLDMPLAFDPGTKWEYGIGIDWAGKIVEAVSGARLGDYFHAHIFEPLGMADTAFKATPAMAGRLSRMHGRFPDRGLEVRPSRPREHAEFDSGGGGLNSTVPDYMAFMRMLLNDGAGPHGPLLRRETVAHMFQNQIGALEIAPFATVMPGLSNNVDMLSGLKRSWGLTFLINEEPGDNGRSAGSAAWAGLANTYYWIDRAAGLSVVLMTQILPFYDPDVVRLLGSFEREVYKAHRQGWQA